MPTTVVAPTGSAHGTSYSLRGASPCRLAAIKDQSRRRDGGRERPPSSAVAPSIAPDETHRGALPERRGSSCSTIPTIGIVRPYPGRYTGYPERYARYPGVWRHIERGLESQSLHVIDLTTPMDSAQDRRTMAGALSALCQAGRRRQCLRTGAMLPTIMLSGRA